MLRCLLALSCAVFLTAFAQPAGANLVARWAFDEMIGSQTAQENVSGFDASVEGDALLTGSGGVAGGALDNGDEGFLLVGDALEFTGTQRFSVQVWVRTTTADGSLVVGRHVDGVTTGYWLGLNDTHDGPPIEAAGSFHFFQSDNPQLNSGDVGINDGQWHQLVAVRDSSSANQLRLYVDGQRVPTPTSTGALLPLLSTPAPFMIGGYIVGNTPTPSYHGFLDEVRVWDNALSDSEVEFFFEHPTSINSVLCGDSTGNGQLVTTDALLALRSAIGAVECLACICDVDDSGTTTSTDALAILRRSVGQNVTLTCPICIAGDLAALRWEIPCTNSGSPVCSSNNLFDDSATLLGDDSETYQVTLRFRGVIEQKTYTGGVQDGFFLTGGTPAGDGYNVYKLEISDPPSTYHLNAGTSGIQRVWLLDVTKTIPIKGGATVTLRGDARDNFIIANTDGSGQPIIPEGVPPAPLPYPGQFIQMDVLSVE